MNDLQKYIGLFNDIHNEYKTQEYSYRSINTAILLEDGLDIMAIMERHKASDGMDSVSESAKIDGILSFFIMPYISANNGFLLQTNTVTSKLVISEYAQSIATALQTRSSLVCALCLRAYIEKISQLNYASRKLDESLDTLPADISSINQSKVPETVSEIATIIHDSFYGSRYNWDRALSFGTTQLTEKQRKKKLKVDSVKKTEHNPVNIMKMVDDLSKSLKPTRSFYDVLSEFTHPNFTHIHSYGEGDAIKRQFADLHFGMEEQYISDVRDTSPPRLFEVLMHDFSSTLVDVTTHMSELFNKLEATANTLKSLDQLLVKNSIKEVPIFSKSDPCPCGNLETIGKCCGRDLHDQMIDPRDRKKMFSQFE